LRNRQQQQHRRGYGEDFEENYALHLNFPHRNLDAPRYNVWLSIYTPGCAETSLAVMPNGRFDKGCTLAHPGFTIPNSKLGNLRKGRDP
jgi:hypothetical protein